MAHVRNQIRDAVVTELKKVTAFGTRVYPYFVKAAPVLPQVRVQTFREQVNRERSEYGASGPVDCREATVSIEVRMKASSSLDDTIDGYAVEIEKKLDGTALDALAREVYLDETNIEMSDLEQDVALLTMDYTVVYYTASGAPETAVV